MEIKIEKIKLNDESFLKESDVEKFYTRKDKVEVDRMVLEESLLKMRPDELASLLSFIAQQKLETVGYVELSDMMNRENYEDFVVNKLLMIANAGRL